MALQHIRTLVMAAALATLAACGGGGGADAGSPGGGTGGGGTPPPTTSPPVAAFTASEQSGTAPLTVSVDGRSSTPGSGTIASYRWDFGNGTSASGSTASALYPAEGSFTITLTVTGSDGATGVATRNVSVTNPPPTTTTVPNLAGLSDAQAEAALASARLTVGTIEISGTSAGGAARVIAQKRTAGSTVDAGTVVGFEATTDPAGARGPIDLFFRRPSAPGAFVSDNASILVQVTSTFELTSGIASMAGRQAPLTYTSVGQFPSPCYLQGNCYAGTLPLAGTPVGRDRLRVRVTDTRGNYAEISTPVIHDDPPRLTVRSPADNAVAVPTLAVDVSCSDDTPGCRVETLGPAGGGSRPHLADDVGGVTADVDLSQYAGSAIDLVFRVFDASGQVTEVHRNIYVESPARLSVAEAPQGGDIFAADGQRLLLVETLTDGDRVALFDRTSRTTETIPLPAGRTVRVAFVTPTGAIFIAQPLNGGSSDFRLYLWRNAALTDVGSTGGLVSLHAAGNFAVWSQGASLYRLNTATGASSLVSSSALNNDNVVAADGTVVFISSGSLQLYRDRAGQQTLLTPDATVSHIEPRTDGNDVVYVQRRRTGNPAQEAIAFIDDTAAPTLLTPFRDFSRSSNRADIAGGWVSFLDLGANNQTHVWTRAPDGTLLRRTDFAASSAIEKLAPNGDVMIRQGFTKRHLSRGTQLIDVGSGNGTPYYLDGKWYVALAGTLLAVDDGP
jgi:hypothetical protein